MFFLEEKQSEKVGGPPERDRLVSTCGIGTRCRSHATVDDTQAPVPDLETRDWRGILPPRQHQDAGEDGGAAEGFARGHGFAEDEPADQEGDGGGQ